MCGSQRNALNDPYLRAIFGFLTSSNDKYEVVLVLFFFILFILFSLIIINLIFQNEMGMSVRDRIGFACKFLSDSLLSDYIDQLSRQLIKEGNLDGMLLTGNNFLK